VVESERCQGGEGMLDGSTIYDLGIARKYEEVLHEIDPIPER
jgi:hypothetical protein